MPVESSAVVSGSTSGLEPIRDYIISKTSKAGKVIAVAPKLKENKDYYSLAFDLTSNDYLGKVYAAVNKFTCMSISANTYINVTHFENKQVPLSTIITDTFKVFEWGGKTQYYNNTEDGGGESAEEDNGCSSGACRL
jgi:ribonucleoside-diphosphate reductase alpha chain